MKSPSLNWLVGGAVLLHLYLAVLLTAAYWVHLSWAASYLVAMAARRQWSGRRILSLTSRETLLNAVKLILLEGDGLHTCTNLYRCLRQGWVWQEMWRSFSDVMVFRFKGRKEELMGWLNNPGTSTVGDRMEQSDGHSESTDSSC